MRKDQPKLRKQFKEQRDAINLLKRQIAHREHVIEHVANVNMDLQQDLLVFNIEYMRLMHGKLPLTLPLATKRLDK